MTWFKDECEQLTKIANIYHKHSKYKQAENSYKLVIDMREKNGDTNSLELALDYYNLAELHCDQSHYEKAAPLYRRAVSIFQFRHPNDMLSALWYSDALQKLQTIAADIHAAADEEQVQEA